ncbi:MAG: aminotransferase class V-fold PLP-dependent enzyme, partial [Agathobacter sp.]
GVGFFYKKKDIDICPLIYGSQMDDMRGGTENVPYIMGMAKAIELASENKDINYNVCALRNHLIWELEKIGCKLIGSRECRLPNNISIMLPEGCGGEEMLYMLDMAGIQCSTGSACNSHSVEPSYVLKAIGLTDEEARRVIRLTISCDITIGNIDKVVDEIGKAINILTMKD